jgi:hypothetical protein
LSVVGATRDSVASALFEIAAVVIGFAPS